jgi:tripartite-type tricarboxylate transporter receptor subunit TctC
MFNRPLHLLRRLLGRFAALGAITFAVAASAQGTANQITLVVPYAPGGPSDSVARLVRPVFERVLGKTTIVENLPGAGGSIGASRVLRATDGSQILIGTPNEVILSPLGLAAVKYKADDFRLVGVVGDLTYALIARADLPAKSLDELIAHAKASSAKPLSYGSMGAGSMNHLSTEAFRAAIGANLSHIPYKGGAPLVQDILAGQLDFAFTPLAGNVHGLIDTGKVKFFGITSPQRNPRHKEWPTVNEGKVLKDFVYSIWFGPLVAKGTPEPVVQRIQAALVEALQQPDIRKGFLELGFSEAAVTSMAEAEKLYVADQKKFRAIADEIKLVPQ